MEKVWEIHGLTEDEYNLIKERLGREPTKVEAGLLGALWSEHCSYKSSKKHLRKLPTSAPWVVQGPGENAGVIEIDDKVWVAFKIESHNHPSYIEPFHGAATGVGGIIRDILSMGARPVALLDSLRFGEPENPETKSLLRGVVSGIGSYGNSIGVPTVGGETIFEEPYVTNPLVNAFCIGVMPAGRIIRARATKPGQVLFLIGSATGRDGVHGAVMASFEFEEDSEDKRPNVQIGDPFFGKKLIEAVLEAVEKGIVVGMQDLGAAGLGGSVTELAGKSGMGAEIDLSKVPLREELSPYEILLSESQERMLLVIEKSDIPVAKDIAEKYHLPWAIVGEVTDTKRLVVKYGDEVVADIPISLVIDSSPEYDREFKEPAYYVQLSKEDTGKIPPIELKQALLKVLSSPNISSKRWIYSQYDFQVGTNTVIIPGGDAAVLRLKWVEKPEISTTSGIALSCEGNGRMVYLDPFEGTRYVVAEACRNVACVGAKPLAITNCLNFGNPERPEIMWQFVRAVEGMASACEELGVPVVSGNVSLYNETVKDGEQRNVYPTPVIACVGRLEEVNRYTDIKFIDNDEILLIGDVFRTMEIGGSEYLKVVHGMIRGPVPKVYFEKEKNLIDLMVKLSRENLINSAHDVSMGGLIVTVLESLFGTEFGVELDIYCEERPDFFLFSEVPTRVVISVPHSKLDEVKDIIEESGVEWMHLGKVTSERTLTVRFNGEEVLRESVSIFEEVWERSLADRL